MIFYSHNEGYDIIIALCKCLYTLIGTGFSGERCGPWAFCFSLISLVLLNPYETFTPVGERLTLELLLLISTCV